MRIYPGNRGQRKFLPHPITPRQLMQDLIIAHGLGATHHSQFRQKIRQLKEQLNRYYSKLRKVDAYSRDAAIEMAKAYINTVALWTPPHMGKKPPSKRSREGLLLYNRTINYLPKLVRQRRERKFRALDVRALREGKLYSITYTKGNKMYPKYFKKNNRVTKRDAVIHMRYLGKASWGASLEELEGVGKLPPNISNVLSKNKLIKAKAKANNKITIYKDRGLYGVKIQNTSGVQGSFFAIADKKGREAASKVERKRIKQLGRILEGN